MDRLDNILKQRLAAQQSSASDHPSPDLLAGLIEHRLRTPEQEGVLSHLAVCSQCRQTVALATSEHVELQPSLSAMPSRSALRSPAAMRWASAVAALAVAVGVGALFYEHQKPSVLNTGKNAKAEVSDQSPSLAKTAPQSVDSEVKQAASKIPRKTSSAEAVAGLNRDFRMEHLESKKARATGVVGSLLGNSRGKSERAPAQIGDAFVAGNAVNLQTQADVAFENKPRMSVNAAPPVAAPPVETQSRVAAAPAPQVYAQPNATTEAARERETESLTKSGGIAGQQSQTVFMPGATMKSVATSAIGGPPKARAAYADSLAHWTISANGKLQRLSQNGGLMAVEPAPGVTVRAVAAQGIEVWAGGSEPDLSATQWQQRPVLFHSSDAGETWTKVDGPWQGSIQSLTLLDLHSLTVVTSDGKWATADAGKSWARK